MDKAKGPCRQEILWDTEGETLHRAEQALVLLNIIHKIAVKGQKKEAADKSLLTQ